MKMKNRQIVLTAILFVGACMVFAVSIIGPAKTAQLIQSAYSDNKVQRGIDSGDIVGQDGKPIEGAAGDTRVATSLSTNVDKKISHNLNDTFVHVTMYDSSLEKVMLDKVQATSSDTIQIRSNSNLSGTVVISK